MSFLCLIIYWFEKHFASATRFIFAVTWALLMDRKVHKWRVTSENARFCALGRLSG
jgi:hypothetical protein